MNLGLISLICLLAAIVIGFVKNCNVGILCTGIAAVLALVFGIKASDIIKGFSASLCIQMVGITYLFAIINGNGTLELLARKMVALVGKQKRLIPFVIYILGFIISAVGPGAIPSLAIIPVIAIPVAASAGINPIMTAIIGDLGVMSGRMSPLTPEAAVVRELMAAQGLEADTVPIMFCLILTALATMVLVYIYYKGWKVDVKAVGKEAELPKFTGKQLLSLAALAGLAVGVLFFSLQHALLPAYALLLLIGMLGGFFVVPLNALLQERGKQTVGAGNAIAVQNLGENMAMLLMLGIYSLAVKAGAPVVAIGVGFGALFALAISGLWVWQRRR